MAIPHPREVQLAVVNWLDERYPFTKSIDEAMYQRGPHCAHAIYSVPGARGKPGAPYNSGNFIQNPVYLGWLIRGVHFWGANILIIMVLLHMSRVYWTGSYRAPRELNWMVGVIMLLCIIFLSLTGYLLPWDTKAYFATEVTVK